MTAPHRARLEALQAEASARLARLDHDLGALRADRAADSADDEHDPEGVTLSAEWSMRAGVRDDEQHTLDEIDAALRRLADGTYGVCVDCGRGIPAARLDARPTATRCVDCAERAGR